MNGCAYTSILYLIVKRSDVSRVSNVSLRKWGSVCYNYELFIANNLIKNDVIIITIILVLCLLNILIRFVLK